jgi:photosystem II stability/assembly factor-like uncharacterized protein
MTAVLLLAAILTGCSSTVPAVQTVQETQEAMQTPETAEPAPQPSVAENTPSVDPPPAESSWTPVLECAITHPAYLAGFYNEDYGITVGRTGEIHYTGDGGQTWPESENSSQCRFCLDIVDENIAWCGGNGGNVRLSSDGGKTWTAVSDINMITGHANIDFVDDSAGWVATPSRLAGTADGGDTWTEISLPEDAEGIAAICLRTPENGYLLSRNGMLYITGDGGATWRGQDLGLKDYDIIDMQEQPKLSKSTPTQADISFVDEMNGTIVFIGMSASGKGYLTWCLTTNDGGATWESELIPLADIKPAKVFLTGDGKYLTLCDGSNNTVVLKRKA